MKVSVLFFGPVRVLAGVPELELALPAEATISDAMTQLTQLYPDLQTMKKTLRFALDAEYVDSSSPIRDGQILALIPPVQGG